MTDPLRFDPAQLRYRAMIGVGGIGAGAFFRLNGNETLGREESRSGRFLDQRDYCKLHIISHYVHALMGADFAVVPIGKVGDDAAGQALLEEMRADGLDTRYVQACPGEQTLYSFCFLYPDGSGGNLTTDNSACDQVEPGDVLQADSEFRQYARAGIALAAPEVPLAAREALLDLGTSRGFFRVAAFNSGEMRAALAGGLIAMTDLLALNLDEAARAADLPVGGHAPEQIAWAAVERLLALNPDLRLTITAGRQGGWCWDGQALLRIPAFAAQALSTAGAGDAHLAGALCGLSAGLDLADASTLGALVAAHSVTSPHTIDKRINRGSLAAFAAGQSVALPPAVRRLLALP